MIRPAMALAAAAILAPAAGAFTPALPTDNTALFDGRPADFYMHVDRDFEGRKTTPWDGGAYGFKRNPERFGGNVILTKFHEGIDIRPVRRDAAGEPLDDVRAIESGTVVHASNEARDSNYGKYIVMEHRVEGAPVYSVYAHLAEVYAAAGRRVEKGARIGRMGYTGAGIDRRRAHLHLEIALLWHDGFEGWHDTHFKLPNKHGIYNGMNLMGIDAAAFYVQQREDPSLTLPQFIKSLDPFFRVRIPASADFQLPRRYPWLVSGEPGNARSWLVSFSAAGIPVALEASPAAAEVPRLEWAKPSKIPYAKATRSLLDGSPGSPRLGDSGHKLLQLLSWNPATAPAPPTVEGN